MAAPTIATTLRKLRKEAGLSQTELGQRVFNAQQVISDWESGRSAPTTETRLRIADALHVPADRLFPELEHKLHSQRYRVLTDAPRGIREATEMTVAQSAAWSLLCTEMVIANDGDIDEDALAWAAKKFANFANNEKYRQRRLRDERRRRHEKTRASTAAHSTEEVLGDLDDELESEFDLFDLELD